MVQRMVGAGTGFNEGDSGSSLFLPFSLERRGTSADGAPIVNSPSHFSFIQPLDLVNLFPFHFLFLPTAN